VLQLYVMTLFVAVQRMDSLQTLRFKLHH